MWWCVLVDLLMPLWLLRRLKGIVHTHPPTHPVVSVGNASPPESNHTIYKVSAVAFDTDGLTMGVGTSSAHCLTFDLRSSRPTFVKEHQYGLPITGVKFHQVLTVRHWDFGGGVWMPVTRSRDGGTMWYQDLDLSMGRSPGSLPRGRYAPHVAVRDARTRSRVRSSLLDGIP